MLGFGGTSNREKLRRIRLGGWIILPNESENYSRQENYYQTHEQ